MDLWGWVTGAMASFTFNVYTTQDSFCRLRSFPHKNPGSATAATFGLSCRDQLTHFVRLICINNSPWFKIIDTCCRTNNIGWSPTAKRLSSMSDPREPSGLRNAYMCSSKVDSTSSRDSIAENSKFSQSHAIATSELDRLMPFWRPMFYHNNFPSSSEPHCIWFSFTILF